MGQSENKPIDVLIRDIKEDIVKKVRENGLGPSVNRLILLEILNRLEKEADYYIAAYEQQKEEEQKKAEEKK